MSSGKRREIGEAGVAGAEIVDRDAGCPRRAAAPGAAATSRSADQQRIFGDLDRQPRRIHAERRDFLQQPLVIAGARKISWGSRLIDSRKSLSGPSQAPPRAAPCAGRGAKDARSRPAAAARSNKSVGERRSASARAPRPRRRGPCRARSCGWKRTSICSWAMAASSTQSRERDGRGSIAPMPACPPLKLHTSQFA